MYEALEVKVPKLTVSVTGAPPFMVYDTSNGVVTSGPKLKTKTSTISVLVNTHPETGEEDVTTPMSWPLILKTAQQANMKKINWFTFKF